MLKGFAYRLTSRSNHGQRREAADVLEDEPPEEYSYPAVIHSADGLIHVIYTWKRLKMGHAVVDPRKLPLRRI
jgi:predicted neuraminidase